MLALFKLRDRLLLKAGELVCKSELTGVAMRVGVTSLRVMMATVVLLDRLRIRLLGLKRVRPNKLGLMTGVKAALVRAEEDLTSELELVVSASTSAEDDETSEESIRELEAKVKSSSISLKSKLDETTSAELVKLGVTVAELEAWPLASTSLDSSSGTVVVSKLSSVKTMSSKESTLELSPDLGSSVASMPIPTEVGKICKESVTVAARMSVLVSSRLVMMVLSPSMEVVQYVKVV